MLGLKACSVNTRVHENFLRTDLHFLKVCMCDMHEFVYVWSSVCEYNVYAGRCTCMCMSACRDQKLILGVSFCFSPPYISGQGSLKPRAHLSSWCRWPACSRDPSLLLGTVVTGRLLYLPDTYMGATDPNSSSQAYILSHLPISEHFSSVDI